MATAIIITARLSAIPTIDMRIMGPAKEDRSSLLKVNRLAMNNPVFNCYKSLGFKDIKYCCLYCFLMVSAVKPQTNLINENCNQDNKEEWSNDLPVV